MKRLSSDETQMFVVRLPSGSFTGSKNIYIYMYIYVCMYVYICMYIYMYVYIYVYIYIYMYVYIYVYIYIYIYMCINGPSSIAKNVKLSLEGM